MSNSPYKKLINAFFTAGVCLAWALPAAAQDARAPALPDVGVGENAQKASPLPPIPKGMTLEETSNQVKALSSEASKTLKDFMGNAAIPRNQAEVESLAEKRRSIMMLDLMVKEAELVQKLSIATSVAPTQNDEMEKLKSENEDLKTKLDQKPSSSPMSMPLPDPVVADITGYGSKITATILMVNGASLKAKVGTQLPNRSIVRSISVDGVVIETQSGEQKLLGFSSSPPTVRAR